MEVISRSHKKIFKSFFRNYLCYINSMPSESEINDLIYYLNKGFWVQLIRRFPESYATIVIKYFESIEEYEVCHSIKKEIDKYNAIHDSMITTNIKKC